MYISYYHMAVCQNLVPLVNIKIAGKWMFIPLKMVLIGIDPYPYTNYIICIPQQLPSAPAPRAPSPLCARTSPPGRRQLDIRRRPTGAGRAVGSAPGRPWRHGGGCGNRMQKMEGTGDPRKNGQMAMFHANIWG